jgi:hypothetical protein
MPTATIRTARSMVVIPSALPQVTWCEDCTIEVEVRKEAKLGGQTLVYLATTTRYTPEGLVEVCDMHAAWHDDLAADDLFAGDEDDLFAVVSAVLDRTRVDAWGAAA